MSDATLCMIVLALVVVLFVWNRLPVEVVALGSGVALLGLGVIEPDDIAAGFGSPVVLFIATLFVVSEGLSATGVTTWAGQRLIGAVGGSKGRLLVLTMLLTAAITALISAVGAVAALLPMAVVLAVRLGRSPSALVMPMVFAGHAGSLLALTGSPINVLVSEAAEESSAARPFGFWEFAYAGVPLVAGTILISVLLGRRLVPERTPRSIPPDLSRHARTLVRQYGLDEDAVLLSRELGVAEVLVVPRSPLIGDTVFPGMTTDSGDLAILAVQRKGHDLGPEPATLAAGDVLLVQGTWRALDRNIDPSEVRVVDSPGMVRRQAVPLSRGAWSAIAVLAGMVALLASGATSPAVAGLLAAGAMVCLRVLPVTQAYDAVSWTTLVIVAGMLPLSAAIQGSGAADRIADLVVAFSGGEGYPLLLGVFLLTAALGQVISNTATTLIVLPIALAAAQDAGISPLPVLMCVAIAAAAAFLTPIATAANLMAMEPGGYRFGDYWRLGLPMLSWYLAVAVGIVPLVWPLHP